MEQMKTLTFPNGETFEITDAKAREEKMERCVLKLVNSSGTFKMTDINNTQLTYVQTLALVKDLSKYVVVLYGNSKLRPQYASDSEIIFIGLDRASTKAKVLRSVFTATRLSYESFELVEGSTLEDYYAKPEIDSKLSNKVNYNADGTVAQKDGKKLATEDYVNTHSGSEGCTVDLSDVVHLTRTIELHLGNELFGDNMVAEFPEGWTYSDYGVTHPANNTNVLKLNPPMTAGKKYLVTITTSAAVTNGFCVYMEGEYPVNVYAGSNVSPVVLVANDSGKVCISNDTRSTSNPAYTITGISVKEVLESGGTDYRISRQNVDTHGLPQNGVGFWNVAIGVDNLQKSITGSRNVSIGEHSMEELIHGARNIGVGTYTMQKLVNGEDNVAIGADALQFNTACYNNVAIGRSALENNNAEYNMAIGAYAMQSNRTGVRNCAVGADALRESTGNDNVGIGRNAGRRSNECNTCIGAMAGYFNKGKRNVAIGYQAKVGTAQNEYFDCIVIGANAGATGSQQIVIGSAAQHSLQIMGKTINFNADGSVTWS